MKTSTTTAVACLLMCSATTTRLYAQAYCALRDPVHQVYEMFPDATSYRSIVRTVGDNAREEVGKRLPFKLHYNELGRHTLYVPVQEDVPLGVVHVRSEESEWGLVEIVWAFNVDLQVVGFRFQRCRDPKRSTVESGAFLAKIKGKGIDQLLAMLPEDGTKSGPRKHKKAEELASVTLRSALKTMVVTEAVWGQDVRTIQLLARSRNKFPQAAKVHLIENPYPPEVLDKLNDQLGANGSTINHSTVDLVRLADSQETTLGFLVRTDWKLGGSVRALWWTVSADGKILGVETGDKASAQESKKDLDSVVGATIEKLGQCATAAELAALEILVVCQG